VHMMFLMMIILFAELFFLDCVFTAEWQQGNNSYKSYDCCCHAFLSAKVDILRCFIVTSKFYCFAFNSEFLSSNGLIIGLICLDLISL